MALFTACICRFGKQFNLFAPFVSGLHQLTLQIKTKTFKEVNEFYRCWKQTKYYRTWKAKHKDRARQTAPV